MSVPKEILSALGELAQRFWEFQCHEFPLLAVQAGRNTADTVLLREAPEDFERRCKAAGDFRRALEQIPEQSLDAQDWATHRLLRRELDDLRDSYRVRAHQRPSLFPMGPEFVTLSFANTATLTSREAAELYVERLAGLAGYWPQLVANLRAGYAGGLRYPQQQLKNAAASVRAALAGDLDSLAWFSPFRRTALKGAKIDQLAMRTRQVMGAEFVPALTAYAEYVEGPLANGARESVGCTDAPDGEEFYRVLMRHFTTTDLSADQVHELGKREVARLEAEMEVAACEAGFRGNLPGYRRYLSTDPQFIAPSKEALLEQIEVLSKRIDLKIPAFFGRIPRITYGVQQMSEAASALLFPAYAQPSPADCSGPGVHWVTGMPAKLPSFMHVPIALHEAWPGHLMHLALIQEMADLPDFRRFGALGYSACLEGWALYCEQGLIDHGYKKDDPRVEFGMLRWALVRACRFQVGIRLHTKGMSMDDAIALFVSHAHMEKANAEREAYRAAFDPTYIVYTLGALQIRKLRDDVMKAEGTSFELAKFHERMLTQGALPVSLLRRMMLHDSGPSL